MRIYKEETIKTYGAWGGAKPLVDRLTDSEASTIELYIEECYPDGLNEIELNDILWIEDEWVLCEMLGMTNEEYEEFWNR